MSFVKKWISSFPEEKQVKEIMRYDTDILSCYVTTLKQFIEIYFGTNEIIFNTLQHNIHFSNLMQIKEELNILPNKKIVICRRYPIRRSITKNRYMKESYFQSFFFNNIDNFVTAHFLEDYDRELFPTGYISSLVKYPSLSFSADHKRIIVPMTDFVSSKDSNLMNNNIRRIIKPCDTKESLNLKLNNSNKVIHINDEHYLAVPIFKDKFLNSASFKSVYKIAPHTFVTFDELMKIAEKRKDIEVQIYFDGYSSLNNIFDYCNMRILKKIPWNKFAL